MNESINQIFTFILENKENIEAFTTINSFLENYKIDKKFELYGRESNYIKEVLGLSIYELNNNELEIINIFLDKSDKESLHLDCINITFDELSEKTSLEHELLEKILLELESENFINIKKGIYYKLDYLIFIKSNLISKIFSSATSYYIILNLVIDILIDTESNAKYLEINIENFINKNNLNYFFINPIISDLKSMHIIQYDKPFYPTIFLTNCFFIINKAKLLKLKKQLLLKENS